MALSVLGFPTIILARIGTVEIDASLNENHRYSAELTENPVEDGTPFTDHVVLKPVVLEMDGRVSDASQSLLAIRGPGRAADAFKALVILQQSRQSFNVVTGLNVYKNMMFEELSVPRTALDGRSIRFSATLREILVVGDEAETNRARIADGVRHTALPTFARGIIAKFLI